MATSEELAAMMAIEDDPCQCVILKTDGSMVEVTLDMTPAKAEVKKLMGGQVAILGQWLSVGGEDLNVVIVGVDSPPADAAVNQHTLPAPFAAAKQRGAILLFRNDENAKPVDFTVKDYKRFVAEKAKEAEAAGANADAGSEEESEEEESEEEESEDEEEGEMTEEQVALLQTVIANFTEQRGRAPTEIELVAIMNKLNALMPEGDDDEDSDCDEDELAAEAGEDQEADADEDEQGIDPEQDGDEDEGDDEEEDEAPPPTRRQSARVKKLNKRSSVSGTPRGGAVGAAVPPAPPAPIVRKRARVQ